MITISGTNLATNVLSSNLITVFEVYVKWNGTDWTDESAYLISATTDQKLADPSQGVAASGAAEFQVFTITMANDAGRYSPSNSAGSQYANISANKCIGVEVRFKAGYYDAVNGDEVIAIAEGRIDEPVYASPTDPVATFSCIGKEYDLLEHKTARTSDAMSVQENLYAHEWLAILAAEGNISSTSLDTGMYRIPYCWLADGDSLYNDAQRIAAAEGGYVQISGDGTLKFRNASNLLRLSGTSIETLNENDYINFSIDYSNRETYNEVECPYKPRGAGAETKLFTLSERWVVPPDDSATFVIKLKQPALWLKTPVQDKDYVVITDGGENIGSSISIVLTQRAQEVSVAVTNSNTTYQAIFRKFELRGSPLVGGKSSQVVAPVNSAIGNASTSTDLLKRKTLPDNDYIQTIEQATMIANLMADRAGNVLGVVTLTGVPCRFWYEPGDRVNVENTLKGYDKDIFITGINRQLGPGPVAEMTITGVEAAGFYPYTLSEYFVLGTDAPGVGKRLFY